jgi:hypothetical protein
MKYKPVKFKDPGTTIHGERPRSMRKHLSMNGMMAPPPVPPAFAKFRPNDNGTHPAPVQ